MSSSGQQSSNPATAADRPRLVELDGLRGVAVLAVLLYHFTHIFYVYFPGHDGLPVRTPWGHYGVHLFFLISGFVIFWTASAAKSPAHFVAARVARLYPTYWVCLILSVVIVAVMGVPGLQRTPTEIAINVTMIQRLVGVRSVDGAYWSLSVELIFYAAIFVVLIVRKAELVNRTKTLAVLWMGLSLVVAVVFKLRPSGIVDALVVLTAAQFAPLFVVGMLLLLCRSGRLDPLVWVAVTTAVAVSWLIVDVAESLWVLGISLAFVAVIRAGSVAALRWRPLVWFGSISYPLYLLHQNIGYAVLSVAVPSLGAWLATGLAVVIVVVLAWAVHATIETRVSTVCRRALTARLERRARV